MKKDPLPDKTSELLTLALDDLEEVLKLPGYTPHHFIWHRLTNDGRCQVCLAGAVMAGTLEAERHVAHLPSDFSESINEKLLLLDALRNGHFGPYEDEELGRLWETEVCGFHVFDSPETALGFINGMRKIAEHLESLGE